MTSSVLIKELSFRNFGLLYLDLSHWQSYIVSEYGQQPDSVTAVQLVKHQLSTLADAFGGHCYRSSDNIQFYVVLKSSEDTFQQLAKDFFRQATDTTELVEQYDLDLLAKHGVILHAGGCHFADIAGIRRLWSQPKRAQLMSNLHTACVAGSVFLTDLPIESEAHYLLATEQLTTRYRALIQNRIDAVLESLPIYRQWLKTIHIPQDILPNIFDFHRINCTDPVGQTALLMESICQDRAKKSSLDPYYSKLLLCG